MLFKWLFILLAALWFYQALRPLFVPKPPVPPPPRPPDIQGKTPDDEGEYIDYEEIK
jgi:hypothetical protein